MSKQAARTRRNKISTEKPQTKEKFLATAREEVKEKSIYPLNERQSEYFEALRSKTLIVATGYAGSSKTFVACCHAADAYRCGDINKIVLARPAVSNSKSLGFAKGDLTEKMTQWIMPMLSVLYTRLGKAVVDLAIISGNIELQPLESIKGMSYGKYTWVIADEVEDCTVEEIKSIVTRNAGAKMVLCGDVTQSCLAGNSGLLALQKIIQSSPKLQDHAALIDFDDYSHIVRGPLCKEFIIAFDKAGY
jgi:phosphate starvation-inducible protein PhoH and related proteins